MGDPWSSLGVLAVLLAAAASGEASVLVRGDAAAASVAAAAATDAAAGWVSDLAAAGDGASGTGSTSSKSDIPAAAEPHMSLPDRRRLLTGRLLGESEADDFLADRGTNLNSRGSPSSRRLAGKQGGYWWAGKDQEEGEECREVRALARTPPGRHGVYAAVSTGHTASGTKLAPPATLHPPPVRCPPPHALAPSRPHTPHRTAPVPWLATRAMPRRWCAFTALSVWPLTQPPAPPAALPPCRRALALPDHLLQKPKALQVRFCRLQPRLLDQRLERRRAQMHR